MTVPAWLIDPNTWLIAAAAFAFCAAFLAGAIWNSLHDHHHDDGPWIAPQPRCDWGRRLPRHVHTLVRPQLYDQDAE